MADSPATADTLGALVQAYVGEQCAVILDARFALASRDESLVHPARVAIRRLRATLRTFGGVYDADHGASFAKELRWAGLLLGGRARPAGARRAIHGGCGFDRPGGEAGDSRRDPARPHRRVGCGHGGPEQRSGRGAVRA